MCRIHLSVKPLFVFEKLFVSPLLDHAAFIQDDDVVRMPYRFELMRDNDDRPVLDETIDRRLNSHLVDCVKRCRRLIEDDEGRGKGICRTAWSHSAKKYHIGLSRDAPLGVPALDIV